MTDFAEPLLVLKEWTRRYGNDMRDKHFEDAQHAAIQIAKASLLCLQAAKEATDTQFPAPTDIEDE